MNHKAVPVTCKAQVLPPRTQLGAAGSGSSMRRAGGTEKAKPLTSGPTGPWKPIAPFRPDIPWERSQSRVSARCPPQDAHAEVLTPRWQLPLCHPSQEGQGKQRDHEGFAQNQENVGTGGRDGAGGHGREAKGLAQERGWKEQSQHGRARATPGFPVNSREAQQDLAGHFHPSPPGKAKSSLSDGEERDLGQGGCGRKGATPCPTPAGL